MTPDLLNRIERYFLDEATDPPLWAPDIVVETPFAAPGQPRRIAGRDAVLAATRAGRASLPVRFDELRWAAVHQTADPEVTVLEYELHGTVLTSGRTASAPFIAVARVRDGQVTHWREYQDTLAIAAALADTAPAPSG